MKTFLTTLMIFSLCVAAKARTTVSDDTVMIELNNKSKILIYTSDRGELKNLEQYDLNKMVRDVNSALGSKKIEKIELEDENGQRYLKDTTIIIGEGGAKTRVKIGNMEILVDTDDWNDFEDEWDEDLPVKRYSYEQESIDRTRHYFNVDIGLNNWMEGSTFPDANGETYSVKPWGSWYIGLNSVNRTWIGGPLFLDWGAGVNWFNWKMENADVRISRGDDEILFEPVPAGINGIKSKISAPYLNITMVPMLDFAKGTRKVNNLERGSVRFRTYKKQGLRIGVGGYAGYRIGGHTRFVYEEDGDRESNKDRGNFYLSNFRYGIRTQVGFKGLDLFATYDLNEVFAPGRGPAGSPGLNAITFGITL